MNVSDTFQDLSKQMMYPMVLLMSFHRFLEAWHHYKAWHFQAANIGSAQGPAFGEWSQMMIEEVGSHMVDLAPCRNRPPWMAGGKNHEKPWICKLNKTTEGKPKAVVLSSSNHLPPEHPNTKKRCLVNLWNQDSSIEIFSCKGSTNACHLLLATSPAFAAFCALKGGGGGWRSMVCGLVGSHLILGNLEVPEPQESRREIPEVQQVQPTTN